jgi:hypothetical protein
MTRPAKPLPPEGYTAVVYAHGMGSQRRFQETGRLLDALDTYQHRALAIRGEALGRLQGIKAHEETWQKAVAEANDASGQVPFVQVIHEAGEDQGQEVRFYEIFWADQMTGSGVWDMVKWIILQAMRPFRWWRAPWRSFHRQRRAVLAELYERQMATGDTTSAGEYGKLLELYGRFDGLEAKRAYPDGDFEGFLAFVQEQLEGHPVRAEALGKLALRWKKAGRAEEWGHAIGTLSLIAAILVTLLGLFWSVGQGLGWLRAMIAGGRIGAGPGELLSFLPDPTWKATAGVALSLVLAAGLGRFLRRSISDVAAWTTYAEADKGHDERKAVLAVGRCVLQQVLLDKACHRVVVIGHSLGTSVACDTILAIARANRVRKAHDGLEPLTVSLSPISHLVTLASPIDKIAYFFEQHVAGHRFARVLESLRGDLGDDPFTRTDGKLGVRWINFWDEADPISGPLHSPVSREQLEPRIENIHVPSLAFPLPGQAHSAYFENRKVVATLFDVIFRPDALPPKPALGASPFGLGQGQGGARDIYRLALTVPWLLLVGLISYRVGQQGLMFAAAGGAVFLILGLFVAFRIKRKGNLDPL